MKIKGILLVCVIGLSLAPDAALAANTVLSGFFDGSEPKTAQLPGTCGGEDQLAYQTIQSVTVSTSGSYLVFDAYNFDGVDITALIYNGSFNPASPQTNLVTPFGIDVSEDVSLNQDTNYVVVVQHWCRNREGAWAVTFSGPGNVSSTNVVAVPAMTGGRFTNNDPTVNSNCGNSQYQQTGPVRVARSGRYYYTDISIDFGVDMCLQIYTAAFNPANPGANLLEVFDDFGSVELQAGQDYYFVVQPLQSAKTGEFFYVFAPPAPFRINTLISGSWFNPPTSGQGFFMDVFDDSNQMFLAWFTYDLQRPDGSVNAMIGEPGHRWMTALGPFSGDTANLDIYWASGMIFDSASPPVTQDQDGSMTVEFTDCASGNVSYDLGTSGVTGNVPIQRLANDTVPSCERQIEGPGKPGPL